MQYLSYLGNKLPTAGKIPAYVKDALFHFPNSSGTTTDLPGEIVIPGIYRRGNNQVIALDEALPNGYVALDTLKAAEPRFEYFEHSRGAGYLVQQDVSTSEINLRIWRLDRKPKTIIIHLVDVVSGEVIYPTKYKGDKNVVLTKDGDLPLYYLNDGQNTVLRVRTVNSGMYAPVVCLGYSFIKLENAYMLHVVQRENKTYLWNASDGTAMEIKQGDYVYEWIDVCIFKGTTLDRRLSQVVRTVTEGGQLYWCEEWLPQFTASGWYYSNDGNKRAISVHI
jgi:hypothetical protein